MAVNEERRSRFLVVSQKNHLCFNFIFYHFYQTCPKVFQNDKRKNFQKQTHTHTHTDIVVEKEKEKPRTRDDDNERRKR